MLMTWRMGAPPDQFGKLLFQRNYPRSFYFLAKKMLITRKDFCRVSFSFAWDRSFSLLSHFRPPRFFSWKQILFLLRSFFFNNWFRGLLVCFWSFASLWSWLLRQCSVPSFWAELILSEQFPFVSSHSPKNSRLTESISKMYNVVALGSIPFLCFV